MKSSVKTFAVALAVWSWLAPGGPGAAQERVVVAGGADVVGLNALDVIVTVPDRSLMDHISDTLLRWKAPGVSMPWRAASRMSSGVSLVKWNRCSRV